VQQAREALLSAKTVAEEYLEGPPLESRDCVGIAQVIAQTSENVGADCIGFSFTPYEGEAEVLLEIPKVRLLDRRTFRRDRRSEVQYFVNFEGFPESEGIWASEQLLRRELHDADALIAALKAKLERERNAAASPEEPCPRTQEEEEEEEEEDGGLQARAPEACAEGALPDGAGGERWRPDSTPAVEADADQAGGAEPLTGAGEAEGQARQRAAWAGGSQATSGEDTNRQEDLEAAAWDLEICKRQRVGPPSREGSQLEVPPVRFQDSAVQCCEGDLGRDPGEGPSAATAEGFGSPQAEPLASHLGREQWEAAKVSAKMSRLSGVRFHAEWPDGFCAKLDPRIIDEFPHCTKKLFRCLLSRCVTKHAEALEPWGPDQSSSGTQGSGK